MTLKFSHVPGAEWPTISTLWKLQHFTWKKTSTDNDACCVGAHPLCCAL